MPLILVVMLIALLQGCTYVYSHLTFEFEQLPGNAHVNYQSGMRDVAERIDTVYEQSINQVEQDLALPFKEPQTLNVYVLNSIKNYEAYSYASGKTRASAGAHGIYFSPKVRERIDTTESLFLHELTHLHIRQYIGSYRYVKGIPPWFDEGVAVVISGGAGAENVSPLDAAEAMKSGNVFSLEINNWFNGLKAHMAYRQAAIFIEYLKQDEKRFLKFYRLLVEKNDFNQAFESIYHTEVDQALNNFIRSLSRLKDFQLTE